MTTLFSDCRWRGEDEAFLDWRRQRHEQGKGAVLLRLSTLGTKQGATCEVDERFIPRIQRYYHKRNPRWQKPILQGGEGNV